MTVTFGFSSEQLDERGAGHTAKEIAQQPAVWRETAEKVLSYKEEVDAFLGPLLEYPDLRIILTGAGTSAFIGEIVAPTLSRKLKRPVDAVATTDIVSNPAECFAYDRPTLLVSFARSGNSPESLAAIELADEFLTECHHLVFTCDPGGRLYSEHSGEKRSLALLMPRETNDQGFAMTSSFTSMILAAWLALGGAEVEEPFAKAVPGLEATGSPVEQLVERLATAAERVLAARFENLRTLASSGYERVVYLGSGPLKGLAHESALKMLELTAGALMTSYESPMGFRHGPKSLLNDDTLAIVYVSGDPYTRKYDLDLLHELQKSMRPGNVIALTADPDVVSRSGGQDSSGREDGSASGSVASEEHVVWLLEGLEGTQDPEMALPYVLVAQLLGLYCSLELGYTPDNPFPSKEVNRVVEGVTIHPFSPRR